MNNNKSYWSALLLEVQTKQELLALIARLDAALEKLHEQDKAGLALESSLSYREIKIIGEVFKLIGIKEHNSQAAHEALNEAREYLSSRPVINLVLPIEPSVYLMNNIKEWFSHHMGAGVVIDIKVVPEIIGGMIIEAGGKRFDYSWQKKWPQNI
jgi:F0F1-type ATP synthase delta subunit